MPSIGVISLSPGAGAKTVSANLAYELSSESSPCLVIDACASNFLRLHFGMPIADERGASTSVEHVFLHPSSLHYLPFGTSDDRHQHPFDSWDQDTFKDIIQDHFRNYSTHVVHLGHIPYSNWSLLKSQFDLVLCVLEPQPLTYAHLYQLHKRWSSLPHNFKFVINKVSYSQQLNQNITQLIQFELSESLVSPVLIRYDQNTQEALATQQPVNDYAPASQGAADFHALTLWLKALL